MRETNGRAAIEAVDFLVWEVVTASGELAQGPEGGLARLLREGSATALAGVAAACRATSREAGREALDGVRAVLRRLGTWLDLAERFGDLPAESVLSALEAQGRAMTAVDELAMAWEKDDRPAAFAAAGGGTGGDGAENVPPASIAVEVPAAGA